MSATPKKVTIKDTPYFSSHPGHGNASKTANEFHPQTASRGGH